MKINSSTTQFFLVICIFILCAYSYHPKYFDTSTGSIQNHLVVLLTELLIAILAIVSVKRILFTHIVIVYLTCLFFISVIVFAGISVELNVSFPAIIALIPPLLGIIIGQNLAITRETLFFCLRIYIVASVIIMLLSIMTNIGGFVIEDQYAVAGKNASGAMLGVSGILSFYLATQERKRVLSILDLCCLLIIFVELLTIRARLATLGTFFIIIILAVKRGIRIKISTMVFVLLLILFIIAFFSLDSLFEFIYNSFFQNKGSDFSSGRTELDEAAISVILNSPIYGNIRGEYVIDSEFEVHNFLLNTMSHYGLVISLPWIVLYFRLAIESIKTVLKCNMDSVAIVASSVTLFLFFESMGEYTYPFGPGTITFIPFLLLGFSCSTVGNDSAKILRLY